MKWEYVLADLVHKVKLSGIRVFQSHSHDDLDFHREDICIDYAVTLHPLTPLLLVKIY